MSKYQQGTKHIIYGDASGNEGMDLEADGTTRYYVLAALKIKRKDNERFLKKLAGIKNDFFSDEPEMRSRSLRSPFKRHKVVREITAYPVDVYISVVDKTQLTGRGFPHPRSFVKHLLGRFIENILKDGDKFDVRWDKIKTRGFQAEVKQYLKKKCPTSDLFPYWEISFLDSKNNLGVQAADVIAGSVRWCQGNQETVVSNQIRANIKEKTCYHRKWPSSMNFSDGLPTIDSRPESDRNIRQRAIEEAEDYLSRYSDSEDQKRKVEVRFLYEFLAYSHLGKNVDWVARSDLQNIYRDVCELSPSSRQIQAVIGRLRDRGIPIVGRRKGGYRLATSHEDLTEFVQSHYEKINPMLRRLKRIREIAMRATDSSVDILAEECYAPIRKAVDASQK